MAWYDMRVRFGNTDETMLALTAASLSPLGGQPVLAVLQIGPSYGPARVQGAPSPTWAGGALRFECPASDAFHHANLSFRSFQVTV